MRFVRGLILTLGTSVWGYALLLAINVIVTRLVGPEGRGIIAIAVRSNLILLALGQMGVTTVMIYFSGNKKVNLQDMLGNVLFLAAASGTFFVVVFWMFYVGGGKLFYEGVSRSCLWLALAPLPFSIGFLYFTRILQLCERIQAYNLSQAVKPLAGLIFVLVLVWGLHRGVPGYFVGMLFAQLLSAMLALAFALRLANYRLHLDFGLLGQMVSKGSLSAVGEVISVLGDWIGVFIINYYLDLKSVGWYVIGVGLARMLLLFAEAVRVMLQSKMTKVAHDKSETARRTAVTVQHTMIWMLLGCIILAVGGERIIGLLYGAAFYPAYRPMLLVLIGIVAKGLTKVTGSYLLAEGKIGIFVGIGVASLSLNLALLFLLVPTLGIDGAALAIVAHYIIECCMVLYAYKIYSGMEVYSIVPNRNVFAFYGLILSSFVQRLQRLW